MSNRDLVYLYVQLILMRLSIHMETKVTEHVNLSVKLDGWLKTVLDYVFRIVLKTNLLISIIGDVSQIVMVNFLNMLIIAPIYVFQIALLFLIYLQIMLYSLVF